MAPVLSHRNQRVVDASRLHRAPERRARGLTLVEGPDLIRDVKAAGAPIVATFTTTPESAEDQAVDDRALSRLSGTKTPRGPVAVVQIPLEWLDRNRNLLVSAGVSDPGNVGTMVRSAAAFGWGFAYMEGTADPWSPKAIRAGGGGQFQTPIARVGSLADLSGWTTAAAVPRGGEDPGKILQRPVALLIGEEAGGLPPWMSERCDHLLTITTSGPTESLNAAVAASIAVFALSKGSGEGAPAV